MADRAIIRIEYNDDDKRFREKCNSNFQQLARGFQLTGSVTRVVQDISVNPLDVDAILEAAFNQSHPIGDIIFTNDFNDPRLNRGRWRQIKDVHLIAAGDIFEYNEEGGEIEHTLTVDEMPTHKHDIRAEYGVQGVAAFPPTGQYVQMSAVAAPRDLYIQDEGGDEPHNNMGPYIAKYCFERIS